MALRTNANLTPQDAAADSGSGKSAPEAEVTWRGSAAPAGADGRVSGTLGTTGESAEASETAMTRNEAFFLMSFVKEGFSSLSSRMDRSERRREKESSTLMEFLKQSFSSLSDRLDRSEKAREKCTEDLAERAGKSEDTLGKRMDRIEDRQLKFFMWIMGGIGAMTLVLGVPLYLPFFNSG